MSERDPAGPGGGPRGEPISRLSAAILRISQSLDPATVLQDAADSACGLTGARVGVITTLDERGEVRAGRQALVGEPGRRGAPAGRATDARRSDLASPERARGGLRGPSAKGWCSARENPAIRVRFYRFFGTVRQRPA